MVQQFIKRQHRRISIVVDSLPVWMWSLWIWRAAHHRPAPIWGSRWRGRRDRREPTRSETQDRPWPCLCAEPDFVLIWRALGLSIDNARSCHPPREPRVYGVAYCVMMWQHWRVTLTIYRQLIVFITLLNTHYLSSYEYILLFKYISFKFN